jgi:DNA-binding NarL/FixJ family response regulator
MLPDRRNENEAMATPMMTARSTGSINVVKTRSRASNARRTTPTGACVHREVLNRLAIDRKLSPREQEIFALLTLGLSGKAIASELSCSHATVRTLQVRIQRKFECHSGPELLASVLGELLVIVNKLTT